MLSKVACVVAAVLLVSLAAAASGDRLSRLDDDWKTFKDEYSKIYKDEREETMRRSIWEGNLKYIREHNKNASSSNDNLGFYMKMNQFGDLSHKEFFMLVSGNRKVSNFRAHLNEAPYGPNKMALPDSVDWRTEGCVGSVMDQGQCGSSWAFGVVDSLAGVICASSESRKFTELSVQQLADCSGKYGNQGCSGGFFDKSFDYIRDYGLESNQSYPYTGQGSGHCQYDKSKVIAHCSGSKAIETGSEAGLTSAVANYGPVVVAVDASQPSFQFYSSGVYYEPNCSQSPDHGALVVGYGVKMEKQGYYIVKNSWGTSWGQEGYIYMSRNRNNNCGIATAAVFPLL